MYNEVMKKISSLTKILLLFFVFLFVFPSPLSAQYLSLSISPPLLRIIIKPKKSILIAYTLKNKGDPVTLYPIIRSFEPKGNKGEIKLKDFIKGPVHFRLDNSDRELNQPFFFKNGDSTQLLLRIKTSENAQEGDYYYTFLLVTSPPPPEGGRSTTTTRAAIGANLLITVTNSGNLERKGKIVLFDVIPHYRLEIFNHKLNLFDINDKIPVILTVANTGRNLLEAEANIELKGLSHSQTYKIPKQNILANSEKMLKSNSTTNSSSLVLSGFFLGRYILSTHINLGEGTKVLYEKTQFYVIPIKVLLVLSFLSILIFAAIYIKKKIT